MKRRMLHCAAIAAALLLSDGRVLADDPFPKDWKPDLSGVYDLLVKEIENAPQQRMNAVTGRIAELRDAELAIVYLRLYSSLGEKGRKQLKAQQSKWIKARGQAVEELGPHGSSRGSIAPMEDNQLFTDLTEKRIKELRRRSK
jgi:uncharacterized protein YecT (DUF1311 family)